MKKKIALPTMNHEVNRKHDEIKLKVLCATLHMTNQWFTGLFLTKSWLFHKKLAKLKKLKKYVRILLWL